MQRRPIDVAWLPQPVTSCATGRRARGVGCRPAAPSPGHRVCPTTTGPRHDVRSVHGRVEGARETAARGPETRARRSSPRTHDTVQPAALTPQQRYVRSMSSPTDSSDKQVPQPRAPKPPRSHDTVQRTSNAAVDDPLAQKPPSRSVSLPSDISTCRHKSEASLNEQLKQRLDDLKLSLDDVRQNKKIVKQLSEIVLDELRKLRNTHSYHWDTLNSGSYYERAKVRETYYLGPVFQCTVDRRLTNRRLRNWRIKMCGKNRKQLIDDQFGTSS